MIETAVFTSAAGGGTDWRLRGVGDTARWHYVSLKFDVWGGQVVGALVLRNTGEEIALEDVRFDGTRLSFRLPTLRDTAGTVVGPEKTPRLSLTLVSDREFRGYHVDDLDARLDAEHELRLSRIDDDVISL